MGEDVPDHVIVSNSLAFLVGTVCDAAPGAVHLFVYSFAHCHGSANLYAIDFTPALKLKTLYFDVSV